MADPVFNETEQAVVPFRWDGTKFVAFMGDLVGGSFDSISFTYPGGKLGTVVYKMGAVVVSTLTLSYTGSDLTSIVKT